MNKTTRILLEFLGCLLVAVSITWPMAYDAGKSDGRRMDDAAHAAERKEWADERSRVHQQWTQLARQHNERLNAECLHCDASFSVQDYVDNFWRCPRCKAHGVALEAWGVPLGTE